MTEADERFDPATDHVVVLGRSGLTSGKPSVLTDPESVVMNGERAPRFVWKAGARHRVRLINITPDDIFSVALQTSEGPLQWRPVAKDGAPADAETNTRPLLPLLLDGRILRDDRRRGVRASGVRGAEVTPRFPDGLTLFKGHRRFTGENGILVKEDPFMVILLHPFEHFKVNDRRIEEIRRLYKKQFHQESVLRVDYQFSVRVTF